MSEFKSIHSEDMERAAKINKIEAEIESEFENRKQKRDQKARIQDKINKIRKESIALKIKNIEISLRIQEESKHSVQEEREKTEVDRLSLKIESLSRSYDKLESLLEVENAFYRGLNVAFRIFDKAKEAIKANNADLIEGFSQIQEKAEQLQAKIVKESLNNKVYHRN